MIHSDYCHAFNRLFSFQLFLYKIALVCQTHGKLCLIDFYLYMCGVVYSERGDAVVQVRLGLNGMSVMHKA